MEGGIKEGPPRKSRCPRMGTEDEAQRDGGSERRRAKQESNKRDSKSQLADCRGVSHVNKGSEGEKSTGERGGGEGPLG